MSMTQTLKTLFLKKTKTKPLKHVTGLTDSEPQERSAVLDLSSKTMSRIASITLFCFLSQTFASILWANPLLPKNHHFHESGYVGLHIVPEFNADGTATGLRLNVSVSDQLYGAPKQQTPDIDTARSQKSKASAKQVCSTLLMPGAFGGEISLLSQMSELSAEIAGIVDESLKDLFFIASDTGDISITSLGSAKTNRNLYISIMGGVTVQNLRARGLCVQARSLDIQGNSNDITHLDYIKPEGEGDAIVTLQKDASIHVQHMRLDRTTFKNYGTAVVKKMTGHQAVLHNYGNLEADILGNFHEFKNLGMAAAYTGKVTANIVTTHNENSMTFLSDSQLKGLHVHNSHKKAVLKALDGSNIEVNEIENHGCLFMEGSGSFLFVKSLKNNIDADLKIDALSIIGSFINSGSSKKRGRAVFSGFCEFDSIDNAGSLETKSTTKIKRRMNVGNTVSGFTNRAGAKAKLTKLEVGYGDTHYLTNNGYLDLVEAHTNQGPKHLKNNNGATLLVRGGLFKTLENEGRSEVHGITKFEKVYNLSQKEGQKTPIVIFKDKAQIDTLTNAGELYALSGLTYTKKFTNEKDAKARIQGLAYAPASEGAAVKDRYDLENQGALDLTQVDQDHAPKRVKNTKSGSLALHDNQGEWDHAVFKDINSTISAFKRGLVVDHLMNEGLFQYWDGVYKIKDIQNKNGATFLTGHKDKNHKNGHLQYGVFSNQGVWESTRGLALRDVTKTGKLRVNGGLTVYGSKGVNLSESLKGDIQAKSITLNGHIFQNTKGTHLDVFWTKGEGSDKYVVLMPLAVNVKDFTNAGRILAGALTLTSDTFLQTDMGLIETQDDINIAVKGDVNNKWGKIRSHAKTKVKSKEGSILVGDKGAQEGYVSKRNGASIEGGTHLTLEAKKTIDAGFGELYLKGKRLNSTALNHVPYMHLKAGLQILLEAGFVYSTRSILFETPTFRSFMTAPGQHNHYWACMGGGGIWATKPHPTSVQPEIRSGGDIAFKAETAILSSTSVSAVGSIKKVDRFGIEHRCSHNAPQGLTLESAVHVEIDYRAQCPSPIRTYKYPYPTTLLSGSDISITDQAFRINGLVAVMATDIGIAVGSSNIHGASGSIFSFAEAKHFFANEGVWTNNAAAASSLPQGAFIPTDPLASIAGSAPMPFISGPSMHPSKIQQNAQPTYVPPVFSSSFFGSASLPRQAFTFLTVNGKPIELTESESLQNVGISTKSVNEARDLPALFSQSDWENLYDMAHSHTLHRTYAENSFTQTLKQAFAYSQNTGSIDFSAKDTFKKPFTAFVIVNKNGNRVLNAYTYTPKEYYNGKLLLTGSVIAAIGGNVQLEAESEFSAEKLAILASAKKAPKFKGRSFDHDGTIFQELKMGTTDHQCGFFSLNTNRIDGVTLLKQNLDKEHVRRAIAEEMRHKLLLDAAFEEHVRLPEAFRKAAEPLVSRIHALEETPLIEHVDDYAARIERQEILKKELLQWCSILNNLTAYLNDYVGAPYRMLEVEEQIEGASEGAPSTMAVLAALQGYTLKIYTKNANNSLKCIYQYHPTHHGFTGEFQERHVIHTPVNPTDEDAARDHFNVLLTKDQMTALLKEEAEKESGNISVNAKSIMLKEVVTKSDGTTHLVGRDYVATFGGDHKAKEIYFLSNGVVHIGESHDVYEKHIDTKDYKEHTVRQTCIPTKIAADYAHFESLGGQDITFVGTQIEAPHSKVITPGGKVHFKLGTNSYYSYRFEDDSDAMWRDQTTSVQQDKTYVECKINGIMDIEGATKVIVEKVQKKPDIKGLNSAFLFGLIDDYKDAGAIPDPAFVEQLRGMHKDNPGMLEYILAKEVHEYTEQHVSGPGAGLIAIVAVATAVCTMGTATAIAGSIGSSVGGGTMGAVVGAAAGGAFSSLCVQTSMALMQNGLDPFKAAKSLCNSDTLKQMGIAAVTAGVLKGCSIGMGFEAAPPLTDAGNATKDVAQGLGATKVGVDATAQAATGAERVLDFGQCIQKHLAHSTLSTGVRAGFGEKIKDPLESIARGAAAAALGQWAAGQIGAAYADPKNPIDPASHKLYHAALGAATGSLMGGKGCTVSGAVGALVAELSADIMKPSKPLEQIKQKEHELGRKLNRKEFNAQYPSVHKTYNQDVSNTGKISKIIAAISAAFAGGNVHVGAATGANAIDNNFYFVSLLGVSALADAAFSAYLVEGLILTGGVYLASEALDFIGVKVVDGGYSYNDRVYGSVNDVLAAVMVDNPVTQACGSIYLVAKTLLDVVVNEPGLDLSSISSYDNTHQQKTEKQPNNDPSHLKGGQSSSASTGGAMPPPEDEDDKGKFKENTLTEKQKQQLEGKKLEGENPGNIRPGKDGLIKVDSEKLGGLEEAQKTFERLTGEKVPEHLNKPGDMHYKILPNGNRIQIRFEGDSGHPKIDITDQIQKILEKVSFK
ncbi:MAG: hypothetical protein COY39_03165 [Alphaproteobacteria bacterium CG_4_10_14_0_8_um_filter_37_21]|nr:MAG: hypothetical protein COY39_03165 [Alphaproteobacteria bacterium CG_4_10_14_0_8_um_filter_37_21]